jgi:hypothetical protein
LKGDGWLPLFNPWWASGPEEINMKRIALGLGLVFVAGGMAGWNGLKAQRGAVITVSLDGGSVAVVNPAAVSHILYPGAMFPRERALVVLNTGHSWVMAPDEARRVQAAWEEGRQ